MWPIPQPHDISHLRQLQEGLPTRPLPVAPSSHLLSSLEGIQARIILHSSLTEVLPIILVPTVLYLKTRCPTNVLFTQAMSTSWDSYFLEMSSREDDEEKENEDEKEGKTGQERIHHYEMAGNIKRAVGYPMTRWCVLILKFGWHVWCFSVSVLLKSLLPPSGRMWKSGLKRKCDRLDSIASLYQSVCLGRRGTQWG